MKIKITNELIPLNVLVLVLVICIILFPSSIVRVVLGIPFLLFIPGYVLLRLIKPRSEDLGIVERIALSCGLSIAVVFFITVIMNLTPWGIYLESVLYSIGIFIFITSIIAGLRLRKLPVEDRAVIELNLGLTLWSNHVRDKVISILLIISILVSIGVLVYVVTTPRTVEPFTEFYLVGPDSQAADFPLVFQLGDESEISLHIINREFETTEYLIEIKSETMSFSNIGPIILSDQQEWEVSVQIKPLRAGQNQKVEFNLYKDGKSEVYRSLGIWVNVTRD